LTWPRKNRDGTDCEALRHRESSWAKKVSRAMAADAASRLVIQLSGIEAPTAAGSSCSDKP
jgi:hypothetical protein